MCVCSVECHHHWMKPKWNGYDTKKNKNFADQKNPFTPFPHLHTMLDKLKRSKKWKKNKIVTAAEHICEHEEFLFFQFSLVCSFVICGWWFQMIYDLKCTQTHTHCEHQCFGYNCRVKKKNFFVANHHQSEKTSFCGIRLLAAWESVLTNKRGRKNGKIFDFDFDFFLLFLPSHHRSFISGFSIHFRYLFEHIFFFLSSTSTTIIVIITTFKIFCSIHLLHSFSIFLSIHYYLNGNGIRHDYSQKEKTKIFPLITFSGNNIESNCIIIAEGKIWKWIHSFIQYFFCNGHQKNTETMRNQIDWKQKRFSIIFPHSLIIIRVVYIWSFKKNHEEKPKQSGNYLNRMVYFRLEN